MEKAYDDLKDDRKVIKEVKLLTFARKHHASFCKWNSVKFIDKVIPLKSEILLNKQFHYIRG